MQTSCAWHFLVISLFSCVGAKKSTAEWDFLVFTQHWPITVCQEWKDVNKVHTCSFPTPEQSWTIHGVWPTKIGSMGPQYCNRTWHFDVEQVKTIEPALNQLWINIEKETSTYSLWAHEWSKHGTCAASLTALGSEFNYFGQGLRWQRQYSMNTILAASDIFPHADKEYTLVDIYKAIKSQLGVEPIIECHEEHGYSYIFELRICFNKELELMDCTGARLRSTVKSGGFEIQTNCHPDKGILYPATMASVKRSPPKTLFLELYKFVSWLQWFTL